MSKKTLHMDKYRTENIGIFSGRKRGESVRKAASIPNKDESDNQYIIVFPDDVYHVASSFFLGMFGDSIRKLGRESFKGKYEFTGPKALKRVVESGIDEALKEESPLSRKAQ